MKISIFGKKKPIPLEVLEERAKAFFHRYVEKGEVSVEAMDQLMRDILDNPMVFQPELRARVRDDLFLPILGSGYDIGKPLDVKKGNTFLHLACKTDNQVLVLATVEAVAKRPGGQARVAELASKKNATGEIPAQKGKKELEKAKKALIASGAVGMERKSMLQQEESRPQHEAPRAQPSAPLPYVMEYGPYQEGVRRLEGQPLKPDARGNPDVPPVNPEFLFSSQQPLAVQQGQGMDLKHDPRQVGQRQQAWGAMPVERPQPKPSALPAVLAGEVPQGSIFREQNEGQMVFGREIPVIGKIGSGGPGAQKPSASPAPAFMLPGQIAEEQEAAAKRRQAEELAFYQKEKLKAGNKKENKQQLFAQRNKSLEPSALPVPAFPEWNDEEAPLHLRVHGKQRKEVVITGQKQKNILDQIKQQRAAKFDELGGGRG